MKALGLVFSARRMGNCYRCVAYCLDLLAEEGFETELLNAYDLEIKPCSHCDYECFSEYLRGKKEECPVKDDVPKIYSAMERSDLIVFGIPNYGGHASGLYRAFSERMQALPHDKLRKVLFNKVKGFIVIGNLSAWGDLAVHEVLAEFYNTEPHPVALLLSCEEYGRPSLKGDLVEEEGVRKRLKSFADRLLDTYEECAKKEM